MMIMMMMMMMKRRQPQLLDDLKVINLELAQGACSDDELWPQEIESNTLPLDHCKPAHTVFREDQSMHVTSELL